MSTLVTIQGQSLTYINHNLTHEPRFDNLQQPKQEEGVAVTGQWGYMHLKRLVHPKLPI
jgi:hypothetical protein